MKTLTICVFLILWPPSKTQFYNSLSVMEILLETQERIINHIKSYESYIFDNKKASLVRRFLFRCQREHELSVPDAEEYLGNPLNGFALIMRLSRDLEYIERILNHTTAGNRYIPDNTLAYPGEEDIVGVVEGMTRLQILYDLDVKKLANGTLTTIYSSKAFTEYSTPLTSCDCFELGLVEYAKNDRSRNVAWMKEALRRYEYEADCPINKVNIYDRLSGDYFFIGDLAASRYWIERRIDASPGDPKNAKLRQTANLMEKYIQKPPLIEPPKSKDFDSYPGLCLKSHYSPNASLTCYYAHGPHPFLLLAPMKAELLHLSPDILLFHDVITDEEIFEIQGLTRPRFHQAKGTTKDGVPDENYCVHQVAWLSDGWSKATVAVARRVAQFSGLAVNVNTAEDFQVANYGTGGFYGPHYDFIRPNRSTNVPEKRFATALFYISDVKVGGATVFTKLALSVHPVKRAAMFWWNLDSNGDDDFRMQHAACPVLKGSRWVMSKWISLSGQELIRPCPMKLPKQKPSSRSCKAEQVENQTKYF